MPRVYRKSKNGIKLCKFSPSRKDSIFNSFREEQLFPPFNSDRTGCKTLPSWIPSHSWPLLSIIVPVEKIIFAIQMIEKILKTNRKKSSIRLRNEKLKGRVLVQIIKHPWNAVNMKWQLQRSLCVPLNRSILLNFIGNSKYFYDHLLRYGYKINMLLYVNRVSDRPMATLCPVI